MSEINVTTETDATKPQITIIEATPQKRKRQRIHLFIEFGVLTQCAMEGDDGERRNYDIIIESETGARNTAERYLVDDQPSLSNVIWEELLAQVAAEGGDGSPEGNAERPAPKTVILWTRVDGQPAVRREIELTEEYDNVKEFCDFENLQPREEVCYTENPDEPHLLARRFEIDGRVITWEELAEANCDDPDVLYWMSKAEIGAVFPGGAGGDTVRRVEDDHLIQFRNVYELTPELAGKIRGAFGDCTLMVECETAEGTIRDFMRMHDEDGADLAHWLDIKLSVEDAGGTPLEMIAEIKKRLASIAQGITYFFRTYTNKDAAGAWCDIETGHVIAANREEADGKLTTRFGWHNTIQLDEQSLPSTCLADRSHRDADGSWHHILR